MTPTTRYTLIPRDGTLTIAARGPVGRGDADRLAALCLSLPAQARGLTLDLTGAGLVGAEVLRRVTRVASAWRYARGAGVVLRFRACRQDAAGEEAADEVPVEVRFPARPAAPRQRLEPAPSAVRGRTAFTAASAWCAAGPPPRAGTRAAAG